MYYKNNTNNNSNNTINNNINNSNKQKHSDVNFVNLIGYVSSRFFQTALIYKFKLKIHNWEITIKANVREETKSQNILKNVCEHLSFSQLIYVSGSLQQDCWIEDNKKKWGEYFVDAKEIMILRDNKNISSICYDTSVASNISIIGRLCKDSVIKKLEKNGLTVCEFRIANNRRFKINNSIENNTSFFNIEFYGKHAQALHPYLKKGQLINVVGYLRKKKWKNDKGYENISTFITADEVQLLQNNNNS